MTDTAAEPAPPGSAPPAAPAPADNAASTQSGNAPPARPGAPPVLLPLQGSQLVLGTVVLSLAVFMNVLDTSIANVSIPSIAGDLGVSPDQGTWVITSFGVANAISLPLTGWLTRRFGQVKLFTSATLLFVIASWLCGLASSLNALILFRILQGAVAGPMIPLSQAILMSSYPRARQGTALGLWSLTTLVAPVAGPLLGGWITDNISWPWIFYINIPIGFVAVAITWMIYHRRETPTARVPIDGIGLGLLMLWVGSLQVLLDQGKDKDWFSSPLIVTLAVVAAVSFVFFLIWELTERHPIVDLTLFAQRNFMVATICILLAYGLFFGNVVLLPLWLQQYMGFTATQAGMVLAPVGLLALVCTPLIGRISHSVDPRILVTTSFVIFAVVMLMRAHFNTSADLYTLLMPTLIQGGALATFFLPLVTLSMSGLSPERIPNGAGLFNFARALSGAFGTSIFTTLWDHRATLHHARMVEHLTPDNPTANGAFAALQTRGMSSAQSYGMVNNLVDVQAFMLSADELFYISGLIFIVLVGLVWLAHPNPHHHDAPPADAGGH
jgi:DHA2 family multidrug resistance protein